MINPARFGLQARCRKPPEPSSAPLEQLAALERRLRWPSAWMIHNANNLRESRDRPKVGGHYKRSTQAAFSKILLKLAKSREPLAERIVTTSPDVTVSTNLGAWVNQRGLFRRSEKDVFHAARIPPRPSAGADTAPASTSNSGSPRTTCS